MKSIFVVLSVNVIATLAKIPWDFTDSNNKFAASVYKIHSSSVKENFLLSPLSAGTVLALSESGAKGNTAEEIRRCLFLPEDKNEIEWTFKYIFSNLGHNQPYSLHTANKIYVKNDFPINNDYNKVAEEVFGSSLENIDFLEKKEAAAKMNQWVENATDKKIVSLIDPDILNNRTRALLLNTLYFKGNWSSPFHNLFTFEENFFVSVENGYKVKMMHDFDATYDYYESEELDAKFLQMPFEGDNASMIIVLPNKRDGLYILEEKIERVLDSDNNFTRELVNVALPKFKIENRVDFKEILKKLGVNEAFVEGEADFSGLVGKPGDIHISEVVQKSFIDVDENGIEAAAATFIVKIFNRNGEPPKDFIVDHPFLFYVKIENLIIFIGRVLKP